MSGYAMIHSFTGGEWSPALYGRTDLEKYPTAVRLMKNFYPHPHGGASNRSGLEFIDQTKISTARTCRLIPFQFSIVQAYVLEFGHQYIRVIKDGGYVLETGKTISGATQADPVVITATAHGFADGDFVVISSVTGMTEVNGKTFIVANKDTDTFELQDVDGNDVDGTGFGAYTSGGEAERVYQITTTFTEDDLPKLKFEQSADVMWIWNPSFSEYKLSRTGHAAWTLTATTFAPTISAPTNLSRSSGSGTGYNYKVTAVSSIGEESVPCSGVAGGRGDTFTWTAVSGADHYEFYEEHNGIFYWIGSAGTNAFTIPSSPDVDYETTPPIATNPFNGSGNYPGCGAFFEQRLVRARTNNKPQTLSGSQIGSFDNMNVSSPVRDDDAYTFTMNARMVNEIRWLVALDDLIIGTSDSEWKLAAGSNSDVITPTNPGKLKVQSRWGCADILPLVIGNTILFVDRSEKAIRDLTYSIQVDGYDGSDLSIMSQHLFESKQVKEWAFQRTPDSIIWVVMTDGSLIGMTYLREHKVWGWHRHETNGSFESVACISTVDSNGAPVDEVYFVVNREIDGVTRRYIERLSQRMPTGLIEDAFFVDSGLTYSGVAATTISGLDHLEGEEVVALADGNVVTGLTVENGAITLPNAASKVHVGLAYTCDIETMEFAYETQRGTVLGTLRDTDSVILHLRNTREIFIGCDVDHLQEVPFRETEDYDEPIELFTGEKDVLVDPGDDRTNRLYLRVSNPLPATVLAVVARVSHAE